jgi:hypothetical protein
MFEEHITVISTDIEKFKKDCQLIGVKPIVIDTQNTEQQVMTSKVFKEDYYSFVPTTPKRLEAMGYEVLRRKYELNPYKYNLDNIVYLESHIRLVTNTVFDYKTINGICEEFTLHKSKNLFKVEGDTKYQMVTYRDYNNNLLDFERHMGTVKEYLNINEIVYDKVEVEACIFDDNVTVDKNWLTV